MNETIAISRQYSVTLTDPDALTPEWGPSWLRSTRPVTPIPLNATKDGDSEPLPADESPPNKARPPEIAWRYMIPGEFDAANEFHWVNINDLDRAYLLNPRKYQSPCGSCGGRMCHSPICNELRASCELRMPFGKHKGMPITVVPRDYLAWLYTNGTGITNELKQAIRERLERNP